MTLNQLYRFIQKETAERAEKKNPQVIAAYTSEIEKAKKEYIFRGGKRSIERMSQNEKI